MFDDRDLDHLDRGRHYYISYVGLVFNQNYARLCRLHDRVLCVYFFAFVFLVFVLSEAYFGGDHGALLKKYHVERES